MNESLAWKLQSRRWRLLMRSKEINTNESSGTDLTVQCESFIIIIIIISDSQHRRPMSFFVQPWLQHIPASPREKFLLLRSGRGQFALVSPSAAVCATRSSSERDENSGTPSSGPGAASRSRYESRSQWPPRHKHKHEHKHSKTPFSDPFLLLCEEHFNNIKKLYLVIN